MMDKFHVNHVMLITSLQFHALEMAAHLYDIKPGDEADHAVHTFVSTGQMPLVKGAKIVFVDTVTGHTNTDEKPIEAAARY